MNSEASQIPEETQGAATRREMIGKRAPDFSLKDNRGNAFHLYEALETAPVVLVFYPRDFSMVCTKQLCNYRDSYVQFTQLGVQLVGISRNPPEAHEKFLDKYKFPFRLLSDPEQRVARAYGCQSILMLGRVSRAVAIINQDKILLYRHVEPTTLTHRNAEELVGILKDLRDHDLL